MSNAVLIIGKSGAGKSSSGEELDSKQTFWVNTIGKDLPFKGWKKKYTPLNKDNVGNYLSSYNALTITKTMEHISKTRPDIKVMVIDDYQYVMSYEYMNRSKEKGFEKFNDIGFNAFSILNTAKSLRDDMTVIILTHSEIDSQGNTKMKTIGKMLDEKITPEGLFTVVLEADITRNEKEEIIHIFKTKSDGTTVVKSPRGMFATPEIPNSLKLVIESIVKYNE